MEPKEKSNKKGSDGPEGAEQGGGFNPMMMMGMMKKMMSQMGAGGEGPMAMMGKMTEQTGSEPGTEAGSPMQNMMGMCMGMCTEMLTAIHKTTSLAAFATPELHTLFGEWMQNLEREAMATITDKGQMDAATLAAALKISEESAIHLAAHLASEGKAVLSIQVPVSASGS